VVIKSSTGKTVDALIADLSSPDSARRDGAVARLTIIGERASQRLLTLAADSSAAAEARIAAFRALDAIGEPRVLDAALPALRDGTAPVAAAAAGVMRSFLHTPKGVEALDRLSETATDRSRPASVRIAAIQALVTLRSPTVQPLLKALQHDPDRSVVAAAEGTLGDVPPPAHAAPQALIDAAGHELPDDPVGLREHVAAAGGIVPVTALHQIVERVRIREGAERGEARARWMAVRAAAHAALAQRGSRLALYDLRETIESAKAPVAVEFMTALARIGDAGCLEGIAAAYASTSTADATREDWWHRSLRDAFRAIVARDGLTKRHAVVKRIEKRFPGLFAALTGAG
jgi:HEAT repeat protein